MAEFSPTKLEIELDDNAGFERGWRITQNVVLGLITLALLAAVAGLMGPGLLPQARIPMQSVPYDVTYDRTLRFQAPARIMIEGKKEGSAGSGVSVHVSRDLIDAGGLEGTSPQPISVTSDKDGLLYRFSTAPGPAGKLILMIRPTRAWLLNSKIAIDGEPVSLKQFVWP